MLALRMKLAKPIFFLFSLLAAQTLVADSSSPLLLSQEDGRELIVNNRILAKVHGKTISVIDVMKKMDVFLARAYPEHVGSKMARFQFYSAQWKNTLSQIIDNELMLADAEGIELKISDGDVRETLQERFGPNVMANLEKIGISYEEARQMIHSEIAAQRMSWYRIQSKALLSVNPQDIKAAYKEYCQKNPAMETCKYQVLSLRAKEEAATKEAADLAYGKLLQNEADLASVYESLKDNPDFTATLSQEYTADEKSLSLAHKEVLSALAPGSYSCPACQTSRVDKSVVFRIFYLKERTRKELPPFEKMSDQLHEELVDKAIARESAIYLPKLRERFNFDAKSLEASIGPDFQPFSLK
jgi:hypothetical protein